MPEQLSDLTVIVNNEVVGVEPNSVKWKDGLGESKVRTMSVGGGKTEQVFAQDLESHIGEVTFELAVTIDHAKLVRGWKIKRNTNVVQLIGKNPDGQIQKTFTQSALTSEPEFEAAAESTVECVFMGNQAV